MKSFSNLISVKKDTNKLISSTGGDWSLIKEGVFVKLANKNFLYTITASNKKFYIYDFEVVAPNKLKIQDNVEIILSKSDEIILSYKEYELYAVFDILDKGKGYKENSLIYVDGGSPSFNVQNGISEKTSFIVKKVGPKGEILEFANNDNGKYTTPPPTQANILSSEGEGAKFEVNYKETNERKSLERRIVSVRFEAPHSIITLDKNITDKFSFGKLSCQKWEIFVSPDYNGDTLINSNCNVLKDCTEKLRIPYMLPNDQSIHLLYNHFANKMDLEISKIREELELLKNK